MVRKVILYYICKKNMVIFLFFSGSQLVKDNQLIKLLRNSSINFLRNIAISTGLAKGLLHPTTVHGLSRLFCTTLNSDSQDWCSLTLVRSIAQTQQLCRAFSTKPWISMLLGFLSATSSVGGNELNLPKQVSLMIFLNWVLLNFKEEKMYEF